MSQQQQAPVDPRVAEVISRISKTIPGVTADAPAPAASSEPAPETPAAPLPGIAEQLVAMISKIESLYRMVQSMSSNPQFLTGVANRIIASEALKEQLRPLIIEILREMVVPSPDAVAAPVDDQPKIVGHRATLHLTNPGDLVMRAGLQSADHPTNPNGLEVFLREEGHDHWDPFGPTPLAEQAIREALAGLEQLEFGRHYYVELFTLWDRDPTGTDKVAGDTPVTVLPAQAPTEVGDEHTA